MPPQAAAQTTKRGYRQGWVVDIHRTKNMTLKETQHHKNGKKLFVSKYHNSSASVIKQGQLDSIKTSADRCAMPSSHLKQL